MSWGVIMRLRPGLYNPRDASMIYMPSNEKSEARTTKSVMRWKAGLNCIDRMVQQSQVFFFNLKVYIIFDWQCLRIPAYFWKTKKNYATRASTKQLSVVAIICHWINHRMQIFSPNHRTTELLYYSLLFLCIHTLPTLYGHIFVLKRSATSCLAWNKGTGTQLDKYWFTFSAILFKYMSLKSEVWSLKGALKKNLNQQPKKKKGGRKRQCPALCEVCLRPSAISADVTHAVGVADLAPATEHAEASLFAPFAVVVAVLAPEARLSAPFGQLNLFLRLRVWVDFGEVLFVHACSWLVQRDPGMSQIHWLLLVVLSPSSLEPLTLPFYCWPVPVLKNRLNSRSEVMILSRARDALQTPADTRFQWKGQGSEGTEARTNLTLPSRGFTKWWKSRACTGHLIEQRERRHRTESKSVKFYFHNKPDDHRR